MASQTRALVRACRDAALRVLKAPVSPGVRQVVRRREERAREVRVGSNAVIRLRAQRPLLSFPLPNFLVLVSSVSGQMTTVFSRPQEKQTMKKRGVKGFGRVFRTDCAQCICGTLLPHPSSAKTVGFRL
jgi:hypothetical protein